MIKSFRFVKLVNLGNIDAKRHAYENETFEAVSDESFEEAKKAVLSEVNERMARLIEIRDAVNNSSQIKTRE